MTGREAEKYIHSTLKFGIKPGLERISFMLERLGRPQDSFRAVHVAGTNGKGSTCAMFDSVLRAAGYRVGLYTSPYIEHFRERIKIDGEMVSSRALGRAVERVRDAARAAADAGLGEPTEFELITAAAFVIFARRRVDWAVVEVGLGGRLDATNVFKRPELCVISSLSLDHTAILGETIEKIAFEKCGILKRGVPAVLNPSQHAGAREAAEKYAAGAGSPLIVCGAPEDAELTIDGTGFSYKGERFFTPLIGPHQADNAATAIEGLRIIGIEEEYIRAGLEKVVFPGRFERLCGRPAVIIDGAHNRAAADALMRTVDAVCRGKIIAVMGMMADKEHGYCIKRVASRADAFIAVRPDNPRALDQRETAREAASVCPVVRSRKNPVDGVRLALSLAGPDDTVLCTGSLYYIGRVRGYIRRRLARK